MTTPNKDFNQYFPNPNALRHYDHKFEWTQHEFVNWCEEVSSKYGYSYELTGVGYPEGYRENGYCTQISVFTRNKMAKKTEIQKGPSLKLWPIQ